MQADALEQGASGCVLDARHVNLPLAYVVHGCYVGNLEPSKALGPKESFRKLLLASLMVSMQSPNPIKCYVLCVEVPKRLPGCRMWPKSSMRSSLALIFHCMLQQHT